MKKASTVPNDDMRPEYDFAAMKGGVRGKYVKRYREGTNLVLLERDVAAAFPTDAAVNEALRAVLQFASIVAHSDRRANKRIQPAREKRPAQGGRRGARG